MENLTLNQARNKAILLIWGCTAQEVKNNKLNLVLALGFMVPLAATLYITLNAAAFVSNFSNAKRKAARVLGLKETSKSSFFNEFRALLAYVLAFILQGVVSIVAVVAIPFIFADSLSKGEK